MTEKIQEILTEINQQGIGGYTVGQYPTPRFLRQEEVVYIADTWADLREYLLGFAMGYDCGLREDVGVMESGYYEEEK